MPLLTIDVPGFSVTLADTYLGIPSLKVSSNLWKVHYALYTN
jgi:hypothetical protein